MHAHSSHTKSMSQKEMMGWGFNSAWQQFWMRCQTVVNDDLLMLLLLLHVVMISRSNLTL